MSDGHDREAVPSSAAALFDRQLLTILRDNPNGLSEYDLFAALHSCGDSRFDISKLRDAFPLFCAHFRLFNALYRLRDDLWREQAGVLEISPLQVVLRRYNPQQAGGIQLGEVDPLRDYYLDSTQLEQTTAEEVERMLDRFWRRMQGVERRREALAVLGLNDPVDMETIRHHYRRLAMKHHPDRGGDTLRLQMINAAMAVLSER